MCALSKLKDETAGIWCEKEASFFRKVHSDHEVLYCEWMDILADVNRLVNVEWPLDVSVCGFVGFFFHWVDLIPVIALSSNIFRDWSWVARECFRCFVQVYLLRCFFCGCSQPCVGICQVYRAVPGKAVSWDEQRCSLRDTRFSVHWNKPNGKGGKMQVPEWGFLFFLLLYLDTVNAYLIAW